MVLFPRLYLPKGHISNNISAAAHIILTHTVVEDPGIPDDDPDENDFGTTAWQYVLHCHNSA